MTTERWSWHITETPGRFCAAMAGGRLWRGKRRELVNLAKRNEIQHVQRNGPRHSGFPLATLRVRALRGF